MRLKLAFSVRVYVESVMRGVVGTLLCWVSGNLCTVAVRPAILSHNMHWDTHGLFWFRIITGMSMR